MTDPRGSALIQLRSALRLCEKDGSDLVSVPLSAGEIRALLAGEGPVPTPMPSPSPAVRDVTEPEVLREAALSGDVAFIQDALGMERDVTLREALEKCRQLASSSSGLGIHSSAGDFLDQLDAIFGVALNALRYPALSHPSLPDGATDMLLMVMLKKCHDVLKTTLQAADAAAQGGPDAPKQEQ